MRGVRASIPPLARVHDGLREKTSALLTVFPSAVFDVQVDPKFRRNARYAAQGTQKAIAAAKKEAAASA